MVSGTAYAETPNLVPVPPAWAQRQQRGPSTNRNINDIYWKRSPRESNPGYIIVGPSAIRGNDGRPLTAQAESWMRKGRTPLIEYSYTDRISPITGVRDTIETNADRLTTPDRYYWFFVNGGAHLFPIEQIVEFHWHITPPFGLALDVFPQLREWVVPEPYYCGACPGERPPHNSVEELIVHLQIGHGHTLPQARDLIASYDVHRRPVGQRGITLQRKAADTERVAMVMAERPPADITPPRLFICDQCGEAFDKPVNKARHVKRHKEEARLAEAVEQAVSTLTEDPDDEAVETVETPAEIQQDAAIQDVVETDVTSVEPEPEPSV